MAVHILRLIGLKLDRIAPPTAEMLGRIYDSYWTLGLPFAEISLACLIEEQHILSSATFRLNAGAEREKEDLSGPDSGRWRRDLSMQNISTFAECFKAKYSISPI